MIKSYHSIHYIIGSEEPFWPQNTACMELIFDSYSAAFSSFWKTGWKIFFLPTFTSESSVDGNGCFSPARRKKKDAEQDFIFHIYFAPMDTVCGCTAQTSEEAGGKIACGNLAGERKSKQGRELRCDVITSYFCYSNLLWPLQMTRSFKMQTLQWLQKPSVSTVLAHE